MRWFLIITVCFLIGLPLPSQSFADESLIAVILTRDHPRYQTVHDAFLKRFGQPKGVRLYVQRPNGDVLSLRNSARKAVAIGADMILTYGATATRAALAESFTTPVFYADVIDPMVQGFIPDQFSPGKNVTGIRGDAPIQTLLKHFYSVTGFKQISALYREDNMSADNQVESLRRIAEKKGWLVRPTPYRKGLPAAEILSLIPAQSQGIFCSNCASLLQQAEELVAHAIDRQLPVISQMPGMAERGALMTLETDPVEQGEGIAGYLLRYLQGASLAELPPERPHNVFLVVNLATAARLGVQIPFDVLSVTSRLIR